MTIETLADGQAGRMVWLTGGNFSGRSAALHAACARHAGVRRGAILIPPEIHPALSGLVRTVAEEMRLHLGSDEDQEPFARLAARWNLPEFNDRDPHGLSGGQQALLVIFCKLALKPRLLALDGALEQLDPANTAAVLAELGSSGLLPHRPHALLAHNGSIPPAAAAELTSVPAAEVAGESHPQPPPPLDPSGPPPPPCAHPSSLDLRAISFRYPGGDPVFSRLDLTLEPGRIYRIAGRNGCGKTTLARLLCGILRPLGGEILVNGVPYDSYKRPGTLAHLHFQSPDAQLFSDTVRAELESLPLAAREPAGHFAGLAGFLESHPFDLPFVLRKRLALTLILHSPAPWLIFDEPTLGQDESAQAAIAARLRALAAAGYGLLFISHNEHFAKKIADQEIDLLSHIS